MQGLGTPMKISELFKVEGYGVVVTGGASGIGLAYAEALAENGARVTILDMDAHGIERESQRLRELGYSVRGEVVDVRDSGAIDSALDSALRAHERLDVVFANAGVDSGPGFLGSWTGTGRQRDPAGSLERSSNERWKRVVETNLRPASATLRAGARIMRPHRHGRMIVA